LKEKNEDWSSNIALIKAKEARVRESGKKVRHYRRLGEEGIPIIFN
jgi:hypothetical protein